MTTQTPPTEERLSRLEGAYEQMGERLNDLSRGQAALRSDMNALRSEMNERLSEMNSRLSEMNSRINMMIVLVGGIWATVGAGVIALFTQL